jgi:hypothetical protein
VRDNVAKKKPWWKKALTVPVVGIAFVGFGAGAVIGVPYAGVDAAIGAITGHRVKQYYGLRHTVASGAGDVGSLFADVGGWHANSIGQGVQKKYMGPAANGFGRLMKATPKTGEVIDGVDCRGAIPGGTDELAGLHSSWGVNGPTVVHNHYPSGPFQVPFNYIQVPAGSCTGGDTLVMPANPVTPSAGLVNALVPPPP